MCPRRNRPGLVLCVYSSRCLSGKHRRHINFDCHVGPRQLANDEERRGRYRSAAESLGTAFQRVLKRLPPRLDELNRLGRHCGCVTLYPRCKRTPDVRVGVDPSETAAAKSAVMRNRGSAATVITSARPESGQEGDRMNPRQFITVIANAAALWPHAARARQADMPLAGFVRHLATALIVASALLSGSRTQAAEKIAVGVTGTPNALAWPFYIAIEKGLFATEDIAVDKIFAPSSAAVILQATAGALDMTVEGAFVDGIRAIEKGAPLAIVRILVQTPPYELLAKPSI